jgi:hypothetical protein
MRIIDGVRYLTPPEIAKLKLITNRKGADAEDYSVTANAHYIRKLIERGELGAINYSRGRKYKFWLISESEIENYNKIKHRDFNVEA